MPQASLSVCLNCSVFQQFLRKYPRKMRELFHPLSGKCTQHLSRCQSSFLSYFSWKTEKKRRVYSSVTPANFRVLSAFQCLQIPKEAFGIILLFRFLKHLLKCISLNKNRVNPYGKYGISPPLPSI